MPRTSPQTIYAGTGSLYQYNWLWTSGGSGDTTFLDPVTQGAYLMRRTYTGTTTPNYASLKKQYGKNLKRVLPMHAHSVDMVINWDTGGYRAFNYRYQNGVNGTFLAQTNELKYSSSLYKDKTLPVRTSFLMEARTRALSRLIDKCRSSVNLAQALGERKQTVGLLVANAERIVYGARALRRGRIGDFFDIVLKAPMQSKVAKGYQIEAGRRFQKIDAKRMTTSSKDFASLWLEYKYGWLPLLQDIHDATELLTHRITEYDAITRISASATAYEKSEVVVKPPSEPYVLKLSTMTRVRFTLGFSVEDELKSALSQTGISNPALLAWELMPYSFVVDWFIPVGGYLEALHAFDGLKFSYGCESTLHVADGFKDYYGSWKSNTDTGWWQQNRSGYRQTRRVLVDRKVLSEMPAPNFPTLHSPLGGNFLDRFATAASLMRVLFKR